MSVCVVQIMNLINLKLSVTIIIVKWPVCTMKKKNIALHYDITPLYSSLVLFKPHMMKCQYRALKGASSSLSINTRGRINSLKFCPFRRLLPLKCAKQAQF